MLKQAALVKLTIVVGLALLLGFVWCQMERTFPAHAQEPPGAGAIVSLIPSALSPGQCSVITFEEVTVPGDFTARLNARVTTLDGSIDLIPPWTITLPVLIPRRYELTLAATGTLTAHTVENNKWIYCAP
jgi:hypothetical protein